MFSRAEDCALDSLLSLLFTLRDKPLTLDDYFAFKPLFRKNLPRKCMVKAGRQLGKSVSLSALALFRSFTIPFHRTMFLTPLKSQASNISKNYMKHLIRNSPFYDEFVSNTCSQTVLFKEFTNQSSIIFLYAGDDAERVRGYSVDMIIVDEVQSIDPDLLPIILETLTASPWRLQFYTGTPLSFDNLIQKLWEESTQYELVVKCEHCSFWNIPNLNYHILGMIGKKSLHISEEFPATKCYKCAQPISPRRTGEWVPAQPSKIGKFHGYHIPQIIMPMHYADAARWSELVDKMHGLGPTPWYRFVNEVLGESYELSTALLTEKDLKQASCLGSNSLENLRERIQNYTHVVFGIDWGGGGISGESQTTIAVAGMRTDGIVEIPFGHKLGTTSDPDSEAQYVLRLFQLIMPLFIAHDCTGAGTLREVFLVHRGIPRNRLMPMLFVGGSPNFMIVPVMLTNKNRTYYKIDKTKSLQLVSGAIKAGKILFFTENTELLSGLLGDFLNLVEEKTTTVKGRETYRIFKRKGTMDDFALASCLACSSLWYTTGRWPRFDNIHLSHDDIDASDEPMKFV